ncbi:uncharacterized protein PFL1_03481 [Pseudozyma flocculosa PF-1]|uniref:Related to protein involved in the assembly of the mitochondrial succinate dehydrogenase complex n=2 Tax=Pseudozyma flocculosa TaxID=84751 RepID=A0A5C3FCU9_9BASI|nr:uncharacterized protein PFL1_03481 [Pseudozyma flocculosa PF-1]EPQ29194.1 hypothetical protein PFL1_03481 [Pseudozyma flocculosa PF-1]SPO41505.1 related to protein involved in the assembly of the mitochondrial succinate dehydrogenase complex [Pseudozyma flocculosa]
MPVRLTAAQKEVLALYRKGLRCIRTKPVETRYNFTLYLRHFFRHPDMGGGLTRRDISAIEYMMRRGRRLVEDTFEPPGIRDVSLPSPTRQQMHDLGLAAWWKGRPRS